MTLDETIEIMDPDPRWPGRFRGERDRVRIALATASLRYEHIGSTAVPGLAAKPIIDMMAGASPAVWATVEELRPRIVALGYEDVGEAGVPGRYAFRLRKLQAFNLSLVERDGPLWRDNLALRDYLRAHPEEAAIYGAAKRALVEAGARTLMPYSQAKVPLIQAMLAKARAA